MLELNPLTRLEVDHLLARKNPNEDDGAILQRTCISHSYCLPRDSYHASSASSCPALGSRQAIASGLRDKLMHPLFDQ